MRNFFSLIMVIVCTFGLLFSDAEARRFGGGKSFGTQRSMSQFSRSSPMSAMAQPLSSAKKWIAPLAGLALGGLLASLFMGHGLGSGILTWLIVGSIIFILFNLIRKRMTPLANANNLNNIKQEHYRDNLQTQPSAFSMNNMHNMSSPAADHAGYPVGFNADEFLREAKVKFIRLQAAYDQKNLADLREFTTPDVFAEIQLQLHERGNAENKTDVISLEAEILEATTEFQVPIASVRFSGSLREDQQASLTALNEVWHFRKDQQGIHWVVTGIQQN